MVEFNETKDRSYTTITLIEPTRKELFCGMLMAFITCVIFFCSS